MTPELEELWARLSTGDPLSNEEEQRLAAAIESDAALRAVVMADAKLVRAMAAWGRSERDAGTFTARVVDRAFAGTGSLGFTENVRRRIDRSIWRRRLARGTVAATLVVAALALAWPRRSPEGRAPAQRSSGEETQPVTSDLVTPPPIVAWLGETRGGVYLVDRVDSSPARAGTGVRTGQGIMTVGTRASVQLSFIKGATAELGGEALITGVADEGALGSALFLYQGVLRAVVGPGSTLRLLTPHAEARAGAGTRLNVSVAAGGTRVQAQDGSVHLIRRSGGELDVTSGHEALIADTGPLSTQATAPGGLAIFVVGDIDTVAPGDRAVQQRLEELGFDVRLRHQGSRLANEARHAQLVVVSSTVESLATTRELRDLAVPLLCWEGALLDDLGMVAAADQNVEPETMGDLLIQAPTHPLAAGLSGTVRVLTETSSLHWARPGPLAVWAAQFAGRNDPNAPPRAAVFGYERGTPMVGKTAPARRVGFFLDDDTAPKLSGAGWALFDAAVRWLTER